MKKRGRPPKYKTEKEFKNALDAYFEKCDKAQEMPNKAGLCVHLGINRDTYADYKKKYTDALKAAEHVIENAWVQRLKSPAATGAIFYLKNAFKEHYKDRHETDITTGNLPLNITVVQHEGAGSTH